MAFVENRSSGILSVPNYNTFDVQQTKQPQNSVNLATKDAPSKPTTLFETSKVDFGSTTETSGKSGTQKSRSLGEWLMDGLRSIKNFFSNLFGPKSDAKTVAQEGGALVKSHTQENAPVNQVKVEERQAVVKPTGPAFFEKEAVAKLNTATKSDTSFDTAVDKFMSDLADKINDKKANPDGLGLVAFTDKVFSGILRDCTELAMDSVDVGKLRAHAERLEKGGNGAKAEFVRAYADKVEYARTKEGAKELFMDLAKNCMKNEKEATFLRGTGGPESSAVKKLFQAYGGVEFRQKVGEAAKAILQDREFLQLMSDLKQTDIEQMSNGPRKGMNEDIAERTGKLAVKLMEHIAKVEVPGDCQDLLAELTKEIGGNPDAKTHGSEMTSRLYSDQIFLKQVGRALTDLNNNLPPNLELPEPTYPKKDPNAKTGGSTKVVTPISLMADMINVVASGVRDSEKYQSLDARNAFQTYGPQLLEIQEKMLTKAGLDGSHVGKDWPEPEMFRVATKIRNGLEDQSESTLAKNLDKGLKVATSKLKTGEDLLASGKLSKNDLKDLSELTMNVVNVLSGLKINDELKGKMEKRLNEIGNNVNAKADKDLIEANVLLNMVAVAINNEFDGSLGLVKSFIERLVYIPGTGEQPGANWHPSVKSMVDGLQQEVLTATRLIVTTGS